jgi:hypothetical protein
MPELPGRDSVTARPYAARAGWSQCVVPPGRGPVNLHAKVNVGRILDEQVGTARLSGATLLKISATLSMEPYIATESEVGQ